MGLPYSKAIENENILPPEQSSNIIEENNYALVMLGSTIAGKTTLINSLINNKYNESIECTTIPSLKMEDIKIDDKKIVKLNIWDKVGREIVRKINKHYIANKIYLLLFLM